jgi:hypothetical protein
LQLKVGVEQLKVKAHEIDQQYKISEKASAVKQQATEKAKKIDEEYKISEKATSAAHTVKAATLSATAKVSLPFFFINLFKAQENPTIKHGVESIKSGWNSVAQSVTGFYNEYKEQTVKAIEEKEKEKAAAQGEVPQAGEPVDSVVEEPIQPPPMSEQNI